LLNQSFRIWSYGLTPYLPVTPYRLVDISPSFRRWGTRGRYTPTGETVARQSPMHRIINPWGLNLGVRFVQATGLFAPATEPTIFEAMSGWQSCEPQA
jgi:hypothetical protein